MLETQPSLKIMLASDTVLEQSGHQQAHSTLLEPTTLLATQQYIMVVQYMHKEKAH